MKNIMIDIFKLYDKLESNMGTYYKQKYSSGRYGSVKGVTSPKGDSNFKSKFYKNEIDYQSPSGFLYPILGSLRPLVKVENGMYAWKTTPFQILDNIGKDLVETTVERSRTLGNSLQAVEKDAATENFVYDCCT